MDADSPAARASDASSNGDVDERIDKNKQLADDLFGDDDDNEEEMMPPAPVPRSRSRSRSDSELSADEADAAAALEYHEDSEAPPAPVVEERTAWINIPQVPLRRTKPSVVARLPNFVRYAERPFDAATWDAEQEDEELRTAGAAYTEISDAAAQFTLHTDNTLRWRWDNDKQPQSNARIVRWSDGTESLQLGTEFFDVTHNDKVHAKEAPRSYVYVPYRREGVLQAEGEVSGTFSLKPNLSSDTHRRLANAIKHHRSTRVVAQSELFGLDPEKEKERIERQLRDAEKRRARERARANRDDDYDDDLGLDTRRSARRSRVHEATTWSDDEPAYDNEDGFIVDDEAGDDDADGDDAPEADDEIDALDAADKRIEEKAKSRRRNLTYEDDDSDDDN
ncbi:Paf1 complex component [Malassezia cuniculi]|uniref:Paf1 complex component n=1 Tax=Malassezia cuniculi TaxID=948313 RepID=A0AAF0ET49_9BASI|nr:Paf1 complex component [Malassezia cuniculi]